MGNKHYRIQDDDEKDSESKGMMLQEESDEKETISILIL
jgi:hypothetical protein